MLKILIYICTHTHTHTHTHTNTHTHTHELENVLFSTDLRANRDIDSTAKGSTDSSWRETKSREQSRKCCGESYSGTLLCYNNTVPYTRQVHTLGLQADKNVC